MPRTSPTTADDRLIVALDVPDVMAGLQLTQALGDAVGFYKIGLGMLTGGGLALANELKHEHGKRIFLDLKLFDIPTTVNRSTTVLGSLGVEYLTLHALGGVDMLRAGVDGLRDGAERAGLPRGTGFGAYSLRTPFPAIRFRRRER